MKYQPDNLFIGNNRTTSHIIGSFLNEVLKSQARSRDTWSQECPTAHTLQHALCWWSATIPVTLLPKLELKELHSVGFFLHTFTYVIYSLWLIDSIK